MGLTHRIWELFSPGNVANSQLNLLTASQALGRCSLESSAAFSGVWTRRTNEMEGNVQRDEGVVDLMEGEFQQTVAQLGGKEKFMLVGEVCMTAEKQERNKVFQEVAQQLFGGCEGLSRQVVSQNTVKVKQRRGENNCGKTACHLPSSIRIQGLERDRYREIPYPVLLIIFRRNFVEDERNRVSIKEILKDVKLRSKGATLAIIGILYCETNLGLKEIHLPLLQLSQYLQDIFQPEGSSTSVSVCTYVRSSPEFIVGVKKSICEALRPKKTALLPKSDLKMGGNLFQCFPWYGRRKERKLSKTKSLEASEEPKTSEAVPIEKTRNRSTPSDSSDGDGQNHRAYFSGKAQVSFRHELDSTTSAADSTY